MIVDQDMFRAAMLDAGCPAPEGLEDGQGRPAGRRFNVYRNNVAVSLTEAMRTGFPVITKLLGQQNMEGLSGLFLRAHPPSSPLMMHYGEAFPAFLESMSQLAHLPYLADVARLELAMRRSYHAADAAPIAADALGQMSPETLMATRMTLAPAVQILCSAHPVHAIWAYNMTDGAPKPAPRGEDVLITRSEFDPQPHLLPDGAYTFLKALEDNQPLGVAHQAATDALPEFDLGATLGLMLGHGVITSLTVKD